jgi:hypothetical protein
VIDRPIAIRNSKAPSAMPSSTTPMKLTNMS